MSVTLRGRAHCMVSILVLRILRRGTPLARASGCSSWSVVHRGRERPAQRGTASGIQHAWPRVERSSGEEEQRAGSVDAPASWRSPENKIKHNAANRSGCEHAAQTPTAQAEE
jgi:hypothetical protein